MATIPQENKKTYCVSEYDELQRVILCQPQYMTIREVINETQEHYRGFEVIEVDITEIIKSGGSFRCCTLPILRGPDYHSIGLNVED